LKGAYSSTLFPKKLWGNPWGKERPDLTRYWGTLEASGRIGEIPNWGGLNPFEGGNKV